MIFLSSLFILNSIAINTLYYINKLQGSEGTDVELFSLPCLQGKAEFQVLIE